MDRIRKLIQKVLSEEKKKRDRCLRIADRKFDKPSAYKSGAVVRCRKGDIWKDIKEENKPMYNLAGNCVTGLDDPYFQNNVCSDATEMAGVVDEFSNEFMNGNEFISKVNWPFDKLGNAEDTIYDFAYNPSKDIYWAYNIEDDVHFFFIKDRLNENYKDYIIVKNIKENDLEEEETSNVTISQKIDQLPQGKLFNDSKNIEGIFKKSSHSWSEVIELFEKNKNKSKPEIIDIKDIHITQPNIQSNKVKNMLDKVNNLSYINVVEFEDGEKVIYDGHHRLVANWALGNNRIKVNLVKVNNLTEDESLHKWFKRSGTPGKEGGWVDCNAPIRKDGKVVGYKPCGRKEGEKRAKYPSCRPTASQCKTPGKGTKWGKTK